MGSRRLLVIVWVWAVVAVGALGASLVGSGNAATLGTLTVTSGTKVEQNKSALTVTARVQGLFTNPGTATINGSSSTFDPGTGTFGTPAPAFATYAAGAANTSSWFGTGNANDSVVRSGGSNYSVALVPWLAHKSTGSMTLGGTGSTINNTTDGGMILNANSTGTSGVAARVSCTGTAPTLTCAAGLYVVTGAATATACGSAVTLNTTSAPTSIAISSFTSAPGASGDDLTATFTRTGGGGGTSPTTITCDPATPVTGSYAGFISFAVSSTTYYDNFLVAYS